MDLRDEKEEEDPTGCLTPSVVTGCCTFVRADADNPSECVCAIHSATALVVLLASLHVFRRPRQHEFTMEAARLFKLSWDSWALALGRSRAACQIHLRST